MRDRGSEREWGGDRARERARKYVSPKGYKCAAGASSQDTHANLLFEECVFQIVDHRKP